MGLRNPFNLGWGHCWIIGSQSDSRKPKSLPAIYLGFALSDSEEVPLGYTPFMRAKQSSHYPL